MKKMITKMVATSLVSAMLLGQAYPSVTTAYSPQDLIDSQFRNDNSDEDNNSSTEDTEPEDDYKDDVALYVNTGEILLFMNEYEGSFGSSEQVYKVRLHPEGITEQPVFGEYIVVNKSLKNVEHFCANIIDNTKSVKKVVLDGKKNYKLSKVYKIKRSSGIDDVWVDYDNKRLREKVGSRDVKGLYLNKLSEGKHTLSMTDKHGHQVTMKVWKDTKAPSVKITNKGDKFIVKITDKNSGIGSFKIDGMKRVSYQKYNKQGVVCKTKFVKSCTVTVTKNNCKKYSYYKKYGLKKSNISVGDRVGSTNHED